MRREFSLNSSEEGSMVVLMVEMAAAWWGDVDVVAVEAERRKVVDVGVGGVVVVAAAMEAGRTEGMRGRVIAEQRASWRVNCREATRGVDVKAIVGRQYGEDSQRAQLLQLIEEEDYIWVVAVRQGTGRGS
jgi:hypothetical protein